MSGTLKFCILILYFCNFSVGESDTAPDNEPSQPYVKTKYGTVKGMYTDQTKVFKGIPYGGSVSGKDRWTDPKPPESWSEPRDATEDPPACPQTESSLLEENTQQNEDCLYLNVFSPRKSDENSNLPVLVFIHGGAFLFGHNAFKVYDGSYLASHSNIIVVTINYRLGALGYLVYGEGDGAITGNFGIKDQRLALQWVKDNIAQFGGNPNQVTLSGQSAGAMSVAIHMTSIKSCGLFHKAIIQSDPFALNYMEVTKSKEYGQKFAENIGCHGQSNVFDCLRGKPLKDVLKQQKSVSNALVGHILLGSTKIWDALVWTPSIDHDGSELTDQPLMLFKRGSHTKVPTIMGTTNAEGIFFIFNPKLEKYIKKLDYEALLKFIFGKNNEHKVKEVYHPEGGLDKRLLLSQSSTDYGFLCPTIMSAKALVQSNVRVYSYVFDHPFPQESEKKSEEKSEEKSELQKECSSTPCHGAELPFVFHTKENLYTKEEKELADIVSKYWGNFVNTGNPNDDNVESCEVDKCIILPKWPQFTSDNAAYWKSLVISATQTSVAASEYRQRYCKVVNKFGYGKDLLY